jgi:hypothetical protein
MRIIAFVCLFLDSAAEFRVWDTGQFRQFSESSSIAGTPAGSHGLSRHLSFIGTPAESSAPSASYHRGGLAVLARAAVAIGSQPFEPIDATSGRAPCQVSTPSSLLSSADHSMLQKRRRAPSLASASDGDDSDSSSSTV